jgi:hypothetical protein
MGSPGGARVASVLRTHAPTWCLVAWKTHAALGRLLASGGDRTGAEIAYAESAQIIQAIAAETHDERLRNTFLSSQAVTQVLERA